MFKLPGKKASNRKTIHIEIKNPKLFAQFKGTIYAKGLTLVEWFEQSIEKEIKTSDNTKEYAATKRVGN